MKIFRKIQNSKVVIRTAEGSPFDQDELEFLPGVDNPTDDILINLGEDELETFAWADIQKEDGSPAGTTQAEVLAYLDEQLDPIKVSSAFRGTDTTTNLNTSGSFITGGVVDQLVPICAEVAKNSDLFTRISDTVFECNFFGEIMISPNVHYKSAGARVALQTRVVRHPDGVGGTPSVEGPIASTGYVRNTNGHAESSLHSTSVHGVGKGTRFGLAIRRESTVTAAAQLAASGTSQLVVCRVR